jgi:tetratricopeptide (TPR) repeat protein
MEVDELTWILLHDKDYAVEALRKHIAEDTDYQYIDYHLAFAETIFDYETMLALFDNYSWDDPVEKLYRYAEYSAKAGKYDDAVKYISELLATQDDQDDIYYLTAKRCEYYRLAGEYDKAIVDAEQLVNIYSNEAYGYYTKGWLYELKGDDQKAMECYNEGIAHDDTYAYIYLMRGEQYLKRGETELAKADFERILELDTEVADGSCRHYALHFLGRDEEAIEWMEQIKDHMPYDCGVYYDEACLYARMGDVNRSLDALSQCLYYGYKSKAHIENDDDLDPIRHTEAYKRLMERYFNEQVSYVSAPYI